MSDLVVDTSMLRGVSGTLRSIGAAATEMHGHGDRLSPLVPAVGAADPARALSDFLAAWSYGLGLTGHQVALVAGMLDSAAVAYETVEARLSVAAGGAAPVVAPTASAAAPPPEPPPPPPSQTARWGDLRLNQVPVQLSAATHPHQLVPGDPDDVLYLGSTLRRFAFEAADAARAVRGQSAAGWAGEAAAMFEQQVAQLPAGLDSAADAFGRAAAALLRHAEVLSDAQLQAVLALRMWQDSEAQSTASRGVVPATVPMTVSVTEPASDADPGAEGMAKAAALLARARGEVELSGRTLAAALDEAIASAPKDPGFFARLSRAIRGFGSGAAEGFVGMGEGGWALVTLAAKLNPATAVLDPEGHLAALKGIVAGAAHAGAHPVASAKALLDWDTWATDPARALGHLAPDLLLALATAGTGTAATRVGARADDLAGLKKVDGLGDLAHLDDIAPLPDLYDLGRQFGKGSDEWAQAVVERYPRLTKAEVLAIHEYSAGSVNTMNHFLRNPEAFPAAWHEAQLASIESTSAALAKLPRYEGGELFRGTALPDDVLAKWQPGQRVSDPAFFSTSTNEAMANGFSDNAFIRVVDHQSGVDVHQFAAVANEAEVLFDRNTVFEVVSRDWNPARNRWDFAVREAAP